MQFLTPPATAAIIINTGIDLIILLQPPLPLLEVLDPSSEPLYSPALSKGLGNQKET